MRADLQLSLKDRRELARLLDLLSEFLESAIECELPPGSGLMNGAPAPGAERQVKRDRKNWRAAEDWKIRLSGNRRRTPKGAKQ